MAGSTSKTALENLDRLHQATDDMTFDETRQVNNHLIGWVSRLVDPAEWDVAVAAAVQAVEGRRPA